MSPHTGSDLEERALLRETAQRFFTEGGTIAQLAKLGFTGLLTPETSGGSGWLPVEAAIVAEEAGRSLSPAPLIGGLVGAYAASATPSAAHHLVEGLLSGDLRAVVANGRHLTHDEPGGTVSGVIATVGDEQPHVAIVVGADDRVLLVTTDAEGVSVTQGSSLDTTRAAADISLAQAPASVLDPSASERAIEATTLLAAADALGALRAAVAKVTQHLVGRPAFEQPIASFQVIQHRLVDLEVLQAGLAALVDRAAEALATSDQRARRLVGALQTVVAERVTAAIDDCIQLSGGLGFTWEWPVHHSMRRAMVDASLPQAAATRHPDLVTGGEPEPATGEDPAPDFRARARSVIRSTMPYEAREGHRAPTSPGEEERLRAYYRTLYSQQLLGAAWPAELGGDPDHHPIHDLIVVEELIRARAPRPIDQVQLASHVLVKFGTDEQKARYLPRIREGRDIWCQLFSEPDAGSDLAGIKARAEQQPDGSWLLGGQKTWTTDGHWAQLGLALLRTSSGDRRHDGITVFVVPMDAPGLVVQPMVSIGGAHEVNDVFLDGVVLAPDAVVGPVGRGWSVAMSGLEVERLGVGGNVVLLDMLLDDLVLLVTALRHSGALQVPGDELSHRIAQLAAESELAKAFVAHHVQLALAEREVAGDGPISKILYTETYNRIARYGVELATVHGPVAGGAADAVQRLTDAWLWSRALTISGGSSEVMRNIIAKRRLHLPQR